MIRGDFWRSLIYRRSRPMLKLGGGGVARICRSSGLYLHIVSQRHRSYRYGVIRAYL